MATLGELTSVHPELGDNLNAFVCLLVITTAPCPMTPVSQHRSPTDIESIQMYHLDIILKNYAWMDHNQLSWASREKQEQRSPWSKPSHFSQEEVTQSKVSIRPKSEFRTQGSCSEQSDFYFYVMNHQVMLFS